MLKNIRKGMKVKVQDIKLDRRTVAKIENGDVSVSVESLKIYLDAIGLTLTYSIRL